MVRGIKLIYLFIVISLIGIALPGCMDSTNSGLEDSLEFIQSVEPIQGAQNVTIDLKDGHSEGATFIVDLNGVGSNPHIFNGQKQAWCIEWDKQVIKGEQKGVKLHSTRGQELWKEVNYFLSQRDKFKQEFPELGWKESQVIIWSLVKHKKFDIDEIPNYQSFDSQFYKDGEYLFDVRLTKEIIKQVRTTAKTKLANESYAIILENNGQTVIIESGESVWAYGQHSFRSQALRDLLEITGTGKGQWGWIFELERNYAITQLIAGGGGDDDGTKTAEEVGTIIGNLEMFKDDDQLKVTYSTKLGYWLNDLHIWVGCSLEEFPWVSEIGNVAPGRLPYDYTEDPTNYYTFSIDLNKYSCSGNIFIAAHAGSIHLVDEASGSLPVVEIKDLGTIAPEYTEGYARGINDNGEIVGEIHEWDCAEVSSEFSDIINSTKINNKVNPALNGKHNIPIKYQLSSYLQNKLKNDEWDILQIPTDGDGHYTNSIRNSFENNTVVISSSSNNSDPCTPTFLYHKGFRWSEEGGMTSLPGTSGAQNLDQWAANDINAFSQIAGYAHSNYTAAFWDEDNTSIDIGLLDGGSRPDSEALAINDHGQIVGYKETPFGIQAFIWSKKEGMTHLGTLPGHSRSSATDINNYGQVVGWSGNSARDRSYFLWDKEHGMTDLGTNPIQSINDYGETSSSIAINNHGQTIGGGGLNDPIYGIIDLGTLDGGGGCTAYDINDIGQVAGWCEDNSGNNRPIRGNIIFD